MGREANQFSLWIVGALLLGVLSVAVLLNGFAADDGDEAERQRRALEQDVAASSEPTSRQEADDIRVDLAAAVVDVSAE